MCSAFKIFSGGLRAFISPQNEPALSHLIHESWSRLENYFDYTFVHQIPLGFLVK